MDTIDVIYRYGSREYVFRGVQVYPKQAADSAGKRIYLGRFVGDNPHPDTLSQDRDYMLIHVEVRQEDLNKLRYPQHRQFMDAADIHGDHLRQVLGRNDEAEQLADSLKNRVSPNITVYQILEPAYQPAEKFRELMTPYEKLELLNQCCTGLLELYVFQVAGSRIVAHRDMKLGNVMLEAGDNAFRVRLIDMASICCENGNGTVVFPMSGSNTSPEILNVFREDSLGYQVDEKTDVYALGGMLAELFGSCNPIQKWTQRIWNGVQQLPGEKAEDLLERRSAAVREKYAECIRLYRQDSLEGWLEEQTEDLFRWNAELLPGELMGEVQALFRKMTCLYPADRPSVAQAQQAIRKILRDMRKRGLDARCQSRELYLSAQTPAVESAREKKPFCVYIIDRRELSRYATGYELVLRQHWDRMTRRVGQTGTYRARAFYFGAAGTPQPEKQEVSRECRMAWTDTRKELTDSLRAFPDSGAQPGYGLLGQVFRRLSRELTEAEDFLEEVHVFMPQPDRPQDQPEGMSLAQLRALLEQAQPGVKIIVHSPEAPKQEGWYHSWERLPYSPPPKRDDENKRRAGYAPPEGLATGADAWFIRHDGEKIFVGKRV